MPDPGTLEYESRERPPRRGGGDVLGYEPKSRRGRARRLLRPFSVLLVTALVYLALILFGYLRHR